MPPLVGAACRDPDVDPRWFFRGRGESQAEAMAVCGRCPSTTRAACLEYALGVGQLLHGIWGGVSEVGRRRLKPERLQLANDGTVLDLPPVEDFAEAVTDPVLFGSSSGNSHGDGTVLDLPAVEDFAEAVTDPVPGADAHLSKDEGTGSARQCSECGGPLGDNRQYTCGPDCARAREIRVKHAAPDPRRNHRATDQTPSGDVPVPVGVSPGHNEQSSSPPIASSALDGHTEGVLQLRSADEGGITAIPPSPIVQGALELVRLASESGQDVALELRAGAVRLTIG